MPEYQIEPADLNRDRDAILAVWRRNLTTAGHLLQRKFDWYYQGNPLGEARCWLLKLDEQVIGTAAVGFRLLRNAGHEFRAGLLGDFAVDQAHRTFQPAMLLQRAILSSLGRDCELLYGLPNDKSLPILKRLGYRIPGQLSRRVKLLRTRSYIDRRLKVPAMAAVASPVLDFALRTTSRETWHRTHNRTLQPIIEFDARFDDLWKRAAHLHSLTAVRTSDFLNWRYPRCPLRSYSTFALVASDDQSVSGYAVTYDDADQLSVADLFADSQESLVDLVAALTHTARAEGFASLACESLNASALSQTLTQYGFAKREQTMHMCVWAPQTIDPDTWYLLRGDEDYN